LFVKFTNFSRLDTTILYVKTKLKFQQDKKDNFGVKLLEFE